MTAERVVRVRRVDHADDASFALLKITSAGPRPLDVTIVGTEGENPYIGSIKHSQLRHLRASNFHGTDSEWETVLQHTLLQTELDPDHAKLLEGVETVASLGSDGQLNITVRKNIAGITQRLGSISLTQDDEQEIGLFDWTGTAAQSANEARNEAARLNTKLKEQQQTVAKLFAQLDDLLKAKQENEDALLQKFTELLNSKKLKIRDQQRLLSGAKLDPNAAEELSNARRSGSSRRPKRKANGQEPVAEDSESDAFEEAPSTSMDVDPKAEDEDDDDGPMARETPEKTESEDEDDDLDAAPKNPAPHGQVPLSSQSALSEGKGSRRGQPAELADVNEVPPPRRELPFAKHNLRGQKQPEQAQPAPATKGDDDDDDDDNDDDDDETDDEL